MWVKRGRTTSSRYTVLHELDLVCFSVVLSIAFVVCCSVVYGDSVESL